MATPFEFPSFQMEHAIVNATEALQEQNVNGANLVLKIIQAALTNVLTKKQRAMTMLMAFFRPTQQECVIATAILTSEVYTAKSANQAMGRILIARKTAAASRFHAMDMHSGSKTILLQGIACANVKEVTQGRDVPHAISDLLGTQIAQMIVLNCLFHAMGMRLASTGCRGSASVIASRDLEVTIAQRALKDMGAIRTANLIAQMST